MSAPATSAATTDQHHCRGTSLYVHVPFCAVKCGYCDFNSYVVPDETVHDRFLAALDAELRMTHWPAPPSSVFIGGGTPSLLTPARLEALFAILRRHVDLEACAEVTMEANPESISAEKAAIARAAGVRRMSMGAQSFDARMLEFLDRAHDADRTRRAFAELREAGVDNLSIDMIFGVPGQSLAGWERDLAAALQLGPDHLSCYNLTFEPGTRLSRDLLRGQVQRNDDELDRAMFSTTRATLTGAGFVAYEVSNFAGRGGPCLHNDHYWLQGDYVGVGPGASSHRSGVRATNLKPVEAWARSALDGVPPVATAETLSPAQRAGEAVWLGIRRAAGVDLRVVEQRSGFPARARFAALVEQQLARGFVEHTGDVLRLSGEGLLFADAVGADFLQP